MPRTREGTWNCWNSDGASDMTRSQEPQRWVASGVFMSKRQPLRSVPDGKSVNNASHVNGWPRIENLDLHPNPWGFEYTNAHVAICTMLGHHTTDNPITSILGVNSRTCKTKARETYASTLTDPPRHEHSQNKRLVGRKRKDVESMARHWGGRGGSVG